MLRAGGKDRKAATTSRAAPTSSKKHVRFTEDGGRPRANAETELEEAIGRVLKCGKDLLATLESQQDAHAKVLSTWKARKGEKKV
jgi:hypothetical protein